LLRDGAYRRQDPLGECQRREIASGLQKQDYSGQSRIQSSHPYLARRLQPFDESAGLAGAAGNASKLTGRTRMNHGAVGMLYGLMRDYLRSVGANPKATETEMLRP